MILQPVAQAVLQAVLASASFVHEYFNVWPESAYKLLVVKVLSLMLRGVNLLCSVTWHNINKMIVGIGSIASAGIESYLCK